MFYGDLQKAKSAFQRGENVTTYLREQFGEDGNTPEIIEIAYDLQAGSYVDLTKNNRNHWQAYTREVAEILGRYYRKGNSVLDVGTGEMTTLAGVANLCYSGYSDYYACDISWSRLQKGREFLAEELRKDIAVKLQPFVANLFNLPFADQAIDIIWTSHSLEPNGGREKEALAELLRVARKKIILFEPYYEQNSLEGRERMERLGYIKGIPRVIEELGATCEEIIPIANISNPLNPTYAFVVQPCTAQRNTSSFWACPSTRLPMSQLDDCFWSQYSMLAYPIIKNIPVLRPEAAILASAME